MTKILDRRAEQGLVDLLTVAIEEWGYDNEEVLPALMVVANQLAQLTTDPEQALDEAVRILEEE